MVIKIGGIEIKKGTSIDEYHQLVDGLKDLEISSAIDFTPWFLNLPFQEKINLFNITDGYNPIEVIDSLISNFSGLF